MSRALAAAALLLGACYAGLRTGVTAPVGHGHGGLGGDIGIGVGGDKVSNNSRLGGGAHLGAGGPEGRGFVVTGAEARGVLAFTGDYRDQWRLLAVSHVAIAFADGREETAASGALGDAFVGVGLGATRTQSNYKVNAGHIAIGFVARRFFAQAGDGDDVWLLGGAIEAEMNWGQPR